MNIIIQSHILDDAFIDLGCDFESKYKKGTRAYVLISQPIEEYWKQRSPESVKEVKWTYVGMRTGVRSPMKTWEEFLDSKMPILCKYFLH